MPRPFITTDIVFLEEHAGDFALKNDLAGLREIEAELRFRKTERARRLLIEVLTWAQELERRLLQGRILELERQVGDPAGPDRDVNGAELYAQVGLDPGCPDFVLAAARRAFRKAHHPDGRGQAEVAEAVQRFQEVEAIFDRLEQQRHRE